MPERESERRGARPEFLLGPGRRAREAGALLATLAALDPEGEPRGEPAAVLRLTDLEELLAVRSVEGLLILEAARVPAEDIGFVRRFLERHQGRRAVVLGADREEARPLLALPRTSWIAWPVDAEELRALLAPAPEARAPEARQVPRGRTSEPTPSNGSHDLRTLLEELLAGAVLHAPGPRFHLRSGGVCPAHEDRALLRAGLEGLLELASACAGGEGLVRASLEPGAEAVRIGFEFPRAALTEKDLPTLLDRGAKSGAEPGEAARAGAERLRTLGASVDLVASEPGRVRCEVRLKRGQRPGPRGTRTGKPEDPFA